MLLAFALVMHSTDVLLRYKFHPGGMAQYSWEMETHLSPQLGKPVPGIEFSAKFVVKRMIHSVGSSGTAALDSSFRVLHLRYNHGPSLVPGEIKSLNGLMQMSPLGDLKRMTPFAKGLPNFFAPQMDMLVPKNPVHVGSRWQSPLAIPRMGIATVTNTIEKIDQSKGETWVYITGTGKLDLSKSREPEATRRVVGWDTLVDHWVFNATKGVIVRTNLDTSYSVDLIKIVGTKTSGIHRYGTDTTKTELVQFH